MCLKNFMKMLREKCPDVTVVHVRWAIGSDDGQVFWLEAAPGCG